MDEQKVDLFINTHSKYFEEHQIKQLRGRLLDLDESQWVNIQTLQFKDPNISLIVSIIAGQLGIDRFLIGDVGLGIGKIITCGGLGIWVIIDWFLIMDATKQKNLEKINEILG